MAPVWWLVGERPCNTYPKRIDKVASHEMAYDAVKAALIAVSENATIFPVVLGHGSDPMNTYAVKSSAVADQAGMKVGSYWPGNEALGLPAAQFDNSVV